MASMLERLRDAMNSHDAEQMASLFSHGYESSDRGIPIAHVRRVIVDDRAPDSGVSTASATSP
jgi:hypothetical protein